MLRHTHCYADFKQCSAPVRSALLLAAAALFFVELLLMGWVETKRWQDFRNPGSQGTTSAAVPCVAISCPRLRMLHIISGSSVELTARAYLLQVTAASLASLTGSRARAMVTPVSCGPFVLFVV